MSWSVGVMCVYIGATYCVCKDGLSESIYQKDIDYACGAGADCSAISSSGACYNPNTVKDHCNYAVNSYFQRKGQASGSCDFSGSATPTQSVPSKYPSYKKTHKFFPSFFPKTNTSSLYLFSSWWFTDQSSGCSYPRFAFLSPIITRSWSLPFSDEVVVFFNVDIR